MRKCATLLAAVLLGLLSALSYAQAPVPFINLPLMPDARAPGGPQFTLTVNGTGFVSNSVVNWNGSALATQFVTGSQLTAIVPATDIATASTGWVAVVNRAPGGGTSNVAFFSVTRNEGSSVGFGIASSPAVGYAMSAAVGDFNGDGTLDLAVTNIDNDTVSVLLGNGKGNFALASSPATGSEPESVAVGDFNGDGKLDLAVANTGGSTVSILLGDGTGNFTLVSSPAVGSHPTSVAVGDFNGDGKLDLAVTSGQYDIGGQAVSILLGDGTGNFTLAASLDLTLPTSVAVGDFNGDGKLDLVVANTVDYYDPGTVSILLGDGTGNFSLASSPATGIAPNSVAVGDFNGDGKLDLAVANEFSCTVSILLGDGTGNFTLASSPATSCWLSSVTIGDFNGDGKLDLAATTNWDDPSPVSILLGDGTGNFTLVSSPLGGSNVSVAVGDFNGDGRQDIAVVSADGTVPILVQNIPGATLSPTNLNFGTLLVGTSSKPQAVALTNNGNRLLKITRIAASANYSQTNNCPSQVPPNGQCTINVSFVPQRLGTHTGTVAIRDNVPNSPQKIALTGVGTVVTLLPSSLNFSGQKVGTTSPPQVATLTNYGTVTLSIHGIHIIGTPAGNFHQTNTCGTGVPAGGSCSISVTFAPTHIWRKRATLEVFDNGGASPQEVALSGAGTE